MARVDAAASIPDTEAHDPGAVSEVAYGVRFAAAELWGEGDGVEGSMHKISTTATWSRHEPRPTTTTGD